MNYGIASFIIVLAFMPLGHALMVLNELLFGEHKLVSALFIGFIGFVLLILGTLKNHKRALASILGLVGGVLVWTGWVEFSFVWIAQKLHIPPMMERGEVVTKPEYLIMLSSLGLLGCIVLSYLLMRTNCTLFEWIQRVTTLKKHISSKTKSQRPISLVVFMETVIIIWFFYILLLLVYDPEILGDRHPITYIVAFGSFLWSVILFAKLLRIKKFDYAVRYAIPTVVIFWNFIEILGRWGLFEEFWIHPYQYWQELTAMLIFTIIGIVYYARLGQIGKTKQRQN